jgi:hypothetical protein
VTWKPLFAAGVKAYFTQRAFVRGEARAVLGHASQGVVFRAGLGLDF